MKRLIGTLILVELVWTALQFHDSKPDDPIDAAITVFLAATFLIASLVMLLGTPGKDWVARTMGLLLTSLGTGILYGSASWTRLVSHLSPPEWVIDQLRACYIVGGPLLLFGLLVWVRVNWFRRPIKAPDYTGPERRGPLPGRRSTDGGNS